MIRNTKRSFVVKRALAALFAATTVLSSAAALAEEEFEPFLDDYIPPISASFNAGYGARLMQQSRASANYRNLSMTPGGTFEEMRFTWHSRSEAGTIRVYDSAGNLVIEQEAASRRLGHSFPSVASGVDPEPRNTMGHWFNQSTAGTYWVHQVTILGLSAGSNSCETFHQT